MSTAKTIALVLIGGAGAYALASLLKPKAAPPRNGGSGGSTSDPCDALMQADLVAACKAARALTNVVGALIPSPESGADVDAKNVQLNGAIVERDALGSEARFWDLKQGMVKIRKTVNGGDSQIFKWQQASKGRAIPRHANGCVPTTGADPKCVAGSRNYAWSGALGTGSPLNEAEVTWDGGGYSGHPTLRAVGDPMTHKHYDEVEGVKRAFPLQCQPGWERWWLIGRAKCCPPGAHISVEIVNGKRVGRCMAPPGPLTSPRVPTQNPNGQGGITVVDRPR